MINFFSYGTLQYPEIQKNVFGKILNSKIDSIEGYKVLNDYIIGDYIYPRLVKEHNGIVFGQLFTLTEHQIHLLDIYEGDAYIRKETLLNSGIIANVYFTY